MTEEKKLEKNIQIAYDKVQKLINFCRTYETWPKAYNKAQTDYEKLSNELYCWLKRNHFNSLNYPFKYSELIWQDDISVLTVIEELYTKYGAKDAYRNTKSYIITKIAEFKNYCETYKSWPTQVHYPKTETERLSRKHCKWLKNINYNYETQDFKYHDLIMPDNRPAIAHMNELYEKYYKPHKFSSEHIIQTVHEIIDFCNQYQKFPRQIRQPANDAEELSCRLANWLQKSNYFIVGEFKYSNQMYDETKTIKEVLDFYFYMFGAKTREQKQVYYQTLKEKNSSNIALELAVYLIKLNQSLTTDLEKYNFYLDKTLSIIEEYHLNIDIKKLLIILGKNPLEQINFLSMEHSKALISGQTDLAYIYQILINYINQNLQSGNALKSSR